MGCYNLLRLLEGTYAADVTCAFVVMEEIGSRGAMGAAFASDADTAIIFEGTAAGDMGDADEARKVCQAGKGVAVSFMDRTTIGDRALYQELLALAQVKGIPFQPKRGVTGGNDARAFQRVGEGKRACVLSVPCRYIHGPSSVLCLSDLDAQLALAKAYAEQA